MKINMSNLWQSEQVWQAANDSVPKLDPHTLWRNPVMFIVELLFLRIWSRNRAAAWTHTLAWKERCFRCSA
jgi:high-affinity K+ transport system ATPase subunit B